MAAQPPRPVRFQRVSRQEVPSTTQGRIGQVDVLYVYMDPTNFRTFSFSVPKESDTEATVRAQLEAAIAAAERAGPPEIEISPPS